MSFLSKGKLPTSIKPIIKMGGRTYYHRKSVMHETDKDEIAKEEKRKGRLVKIKMYERQMGDGCLAFTSYAIYSTN